MKPHRFSRLERLIGSQSLTRLAHVHVAVFGVGGVGSYAVEALARSGIGQLTLIDGDRVCPSNVNRQIHALESTIGQQKVEAMANRCRAIHPQIKVNTHACYYDEEKAHRLLSARYDMVLDCIDQVTAKIHLIQQCKEQGQPLIASMGAANKLDPTQVKVADLFSTQKCRLAKIMRRELRKRAITRDVPVVYSTEEFRPLESETSSASAGQRRSVPLGSSAFVPPVFGLTMAGETVRILLNSEPPQP